MQRFLQILAGVGPLILAAIPETAPYAGLISNSIGIAQQIPGATGPQKKQAALQLVVNGITAANQVMGRTLADPTSLADVVGDGIDTTVKAVKLIQQSHPVSAPQPAA